MPLIDGADRTITPIKTTIIRIGVALEIEFAAGVGSTPGIADAMRPRVVRIDRHTTCRAALDGNEKGVIARRTAGVRVNHRTKKFSGVRIGQTEAPALIGVGGRRARWIVGAIQS